MDAYLRFEGPDVEGDSEDKSHKGWIEPIEWSWGLEMPLTQAKSTGGARTAGQVKPELFTFKKVMDQTTYDLYKAMCTGVHYDKVTLEVMRSIGTGAALHKMVFCKYEMKSVVIADVSFDGGGDDAPTETIQLHPGLVVYTYNHVDPRKPKEVTPVPFGWDFIANKAASG